MYLFEMDEVCLIHHYCFDPIFTSFVVHWVQNFPCGDFQSTALTCALFPMNVCDEFGSSAEMKDLAAHP